MSSKHYRAIALALSLIGSLIASKPLFAQSAPAAAERPSAGAKPTAREIDAAIAKGIDYLVTKGQSSDGAYSSRAGGAITALAVAAILQNGRGADDPRLSKSLKLIEGYVHPDGGIYSEKSRIPNYETCVALVALAAANKDGRYDKIIASAEKYAKGLQWDQTEGVDKSDVNYGGVGYGKESAP